MTPILFGLQAPVVAAISLAVGYVALLGLLLRRRGLRNRVSVVLALYLVLSVFWTISISLTLWLGLREDVPLLGARLGADLLPALAPLMVALTLLFLERPGARWAAIIGGVWWLLILLLDFNAFNVQDLLLRSQVTNSVAVLIQALRVASWAGFSGGVLLLVAVDFLQTRRPLHRNRILFWLLGLVLVSGGESLTLLDKTRFLVDVVQLGLAAHFLGAIVLLVAAISYHLPVLRTFARQALAALSVTLVVGGSILAGMFIVLTVASQQNTFSTLVTAVALAVILAILQQPLRVGLERWIAHLMSSGAYDPARALRDYGEAISNILDLDTLATVAVGIIAEALDVRRGALMLITEYEDASVEAKILPGMGAVALDRVELCPESPILASLRRGDAPLTQYEIDIVPQYRAAPMRERTWLQALEMEVYVPIRAQGYLTGVFALGRKESGEPYTAQDLDVLLPVGNQTATVLQNARLVSDLKSANQSIAQLNDELTASNRRLEKLDLAKTDFIEIASHELRTPLTQIRGYSDILADVVKQGNAELAHMTQISQGITRASSRLEEIVTAMLDVSRISSQALDIHTTPISLPLVVKMALDSYKDAINSRHMNIQLIDLDALPPLPGDLQRLTQAFGNLIGNSIKYTPDGGLITISGQTFQETASGVVQDYVEVLIADTGIGIDPDDQILIFEKFYRVGAVELHSTGATKFKGAGPGLGLPITKGVIQAHGGKIWVESPGRDEVRLPGSTFHVLLPAVLIPPNGDKSG